MMRLPKEITESRIIRKTGIVAHRRRRIRLVARHTAEDWDRPATRLRESGGALRQWRKRNPIDDKSGSGAGVAREDGSKDSAGRKFGVVKVKRGDLTAEVAAFRIDGNYSDHRRPDEVIFTDNIEEDLARRDFTINGIAYQPQKGIIDPFNGRKDQDRLIRTIGDPENGKRRSLRILRGIRLAGQLFRPDHRHT